MGFFMHPKCDQLFVYHMQESGENDPLVDHNHMTLEFISCSDGKEAVTKAANLVFMKYMKSTKLAGKQDEQIFTETHMAEALKAIGLAYY